MLTPKWRGKGYDWVERTWDVRWWRWRWELRKLFSLFQNRRGIYIIGKQWWREVATGHQWCWWEHNLCKAVDGDNYGLWWRKKTTKNKKKQSKDEGRHAGKGWKRGKSPLIYGKNLDHSGLALKFLLVWFFFSFWQCFETGPGHWIGESREWRV